MADVKPAPLASVPMFSVPTIDLSKVNPTGVGTDPEITAEYKNLLETQKRYADELEQRYAQPNWFKISAGFAKPQLGGFTASLGSAAEAFGEQEELRRAISPTVAQMRAEIAKGNIALTQGKKAAEIGEKATAENRLLGPVEAAQQASLVSGPGAMAAAGQNISTAQSNQIAQQLQSGATYTQLTAQFPKSFVDQAIESAKRMYPNLVLPPDTPPALRGGAAPAGGVPAAGAPAAGGTRIVPGVPQSMIADLPLGPQLEAQAQAVQSAQAQRDKINTELTQQSTTAVPIFEAATNLYKAASNPDLAKAFGVFEQGDPMGAIGKALESGSFPRVMENMRSQIIAARLGGDREKRAISDLQAMEGALAELKVQMNNNVINPTDFRTVAEGESIPGIRNTQDAFLRGAARIGSVALTRYETKSAFDRALDDPNFNVMTWASSPYYRDVQERAKKRTQALITNPASRDLPRFMQEGLSTAVQPEKKSEKKSAQSRPNERTIGGKTYVRQPDGSYKEKE